MNQSFVYINRNIPSLSSSILSLSSSILSLSPNTLSLSSILSLSSKTRFLINQLWLMINPDYNLIHLELLIKLKDKNLFKNILCAGIFETSDSLFSLPSFSLPSLFYSLPSLSLPLLHHSPVIFFQLELDGRLSTLTFLKLRSVQFYQLLFFHHSPLSQPLFKCVLDSASQCLLSLPLFLSSWCVQRRAEKRMNGGER